MRKIRTVKKFAYPSASMRCIVLASSVRPPAQCARSSRLLDTRAQPHPLRHPRRRCSSGLLVCAHTLLPLPAASAASCCSCSSVRCCSSIRCCSRSSVRCCCSAGSHTAAPASSYAPAAPARWHAAAASAGWSLLLEQLLVLTLLVRTPSAVCPYTSGCSSVRSVACPRFPPSAILCSLRSPSYAPPACPPGPLTVRCTACDARCWFCRPAAPADAVGSAVAAAGSPVAAAGSTTVLLVTLPPLLVQSFPLLAS